MLAVTTRLSVNLNAVALLRNRRDLPWPSVTHLGRMALEAGAYGLTVHPRPDERHVRFSDLPELRALIGERNEGRDEGDLIPDDGVKADLVAALEADDEQHSN